MWGTGRNPRATLPATGFCIALVLAFFSTVALAQDQAKVSPETTKVVLDNARVRVLDARYPPGGKIPMHQHPAHIIYALTDVNLKFTFPNAAPTEKRLKAGDIIWGESVTHALENIGKAEVHYILIELK